MNTEPDSPENNDDNMPDASELLDFELIAKSQPEKGRGLWLWVVLILVLAGGGLAGWMYLDDAQDEVASADGVPLIMSPGFDLKEKPADPGGMKVPDRDKSVYGRMNGEGADEAKVERLLPPPETPIEPPKTQAEAVALPQPTTKPAPQPAPMTPKVQAPTPPPAAPKPLQAQPTPAPAPTPVVKAAPAPAPVVKPAPKPMLKATAPAGQGYLVQLSAVRTEQVAKSEWARLAKKHPDVLGSLEMVIQRADLGAKGIFYRVRGGWFSNRAEAKAICDELARRNVGCIIAKP